MAEQLPERVAQFLTRRTRLIYIATALVVAGCVLAVVLACRLDSEVLNLLPGHFDSVKTFKVFDEEFSQAREITFAIHDESKTDLDAFTEHFAEMLRAEPWVLRVMDRSPLETAEGVHDVPAMVVPLLLNLEPAEFDQAMRALEPAAIETRLKKLRSELEAGSPKAEFELQFDPLGITGPALKPLSGSFAADQTRSLTSEDGTLRLVFAVTTQTDLGAHACQATMRQVDDFKHRVTESWRGAAAAPEILATGRTPYVGELSLKMRRDVVSTFGGSFLTVAGLFYLGFGRVRPLFAIMHVLLLCCVLSVGAAALIFRELNMITIGLCAILIGLGEDFGMILYTFYQRERAAGHDHTAAIAAALRHHGSGVIYGSLTTAAAFLCLLLSGCAGFNQLGALIAIGILFAGALMMTLFFVFISQEHRPPRIDLVSAGGDWFIHKALAAPRAFSLVAGLFLIALTFYVISPFGRLNFDADPRSLEPRNSNAGRATRTIQAKMPHLGEPLLVLMQARTAEEMHEWWNRAQKSWSALVAQSRLKSAVTPAALTISPARTRINAAKLSPEKVTTLRAAFLQTLSAEGFQPDAFQPALALLDALTAAARGDVELNWHKVLPEHSPWWFILDRFFGDHPLVSVGYVSPPRKIESFADKEEIRNAITLSDIDMHISGWTYTLADLIPWAKWKSVQLTVAMIAFNIVLLSVLCRRVFPLFILMLNLALSIGAMLATLKLCGVPLNLFNILAFPLVLGVGVDYGIYMVIAMRAKDVTLELKTIFKPVLLSGLTTVAGFGSLVTAQNPALWSLGIVSSVGIAWCLVTTFLFVLPLFLWRKRI